MTGEKVSGNIGFGDGNRWPRVLEFDDIVKKS